MILFDINPNAIHIYGENNKGSRKLILSITNNDNKYRQIAHLLIDKKYAIIRDIIAEKYNQYLCQKKELEEKMEMCDDVINEINREVEK